MLSPCGPPYFGGIPLAGLATVPSTRCVRLLPALHRFGSPIEGLSRAGHGRAEISPRGSGSRYAARCNPPRLIRSFVITNPERRRRKPDAPSATRRDRPAAHTGPPAAGTEAKTGCRAHERGKQPSQGARSLVQACLRLLAWRPMPEAGSYVIARLRPRGSAARYLSASHPRRTPCSSAGPRSSAG